MLIALVIGLAYVKPIPIITTYIVLAGLALRSPLWAFRALLVGVLATMLTQAVTHDFIPIDQRDGARISVSPEVLFGRYILLFAATLRMLRSRKHLPGAGHYWFAYGLFAATLLLNSLVVSYEPWISLLKAVTLLIGIFTVLSLVRFDNGRGDLERVFLVLFGLVVVIGFPLVAVSEGYMVNARGFQGLLNHPQALGPFCGMFGAYLFIRAMGGGPATKWLWALLAIAMVSLILSQARTGLLAFLVGSAVGGGSLFLRKDSVSRLVPASILFAFLCVAVTLTMPQVPQILEEFVNKRDLGEVNLAAMWGETRAYLAARSMEGFWQSPMVGWGFGLPWSPFDLTVKRDPFFNFPIGASVEKGLIFTATLEELGILGSLFAGLFLAWILVRALSSRPEGAALVFAAVGTNIGESTLTSFGGAGGFVWICIAVGLSLRKTEHARALRRCEGQRPSGRTSTPLPPPAIRPAAISALPLR